MSDASGAEEAEDNRIRLKPKPIEIAPEEGFEKHDLFGYKKFGESLASLFVNAPDLDVAVLDDEWGSGKTIFAKQWAGHMRNKGHLVVEIDAFANDYQDDPFNLLVLEILAAGDGVSISEEFKGVASKLGASILFNLAEIMTAGAVKGEDIEAALKSKYDGAKDAMKEVEKFKEQLSSIAKKAKEAKEATEATEAKGEKLIIIVDELDRCRPDFAIRFIERIKHFFDVPNVSFLLITSKAHLASMVGNLYGFDDATSDRYLSKFIDVSMRLPSRTPSMRSKLEPYIKHLAEKAMPGDTLANTQYSVDGLMIYTAEMFDMSLRDVEKVYSTFCLTCLITNFEPGFRSIVLAFAFLRTLSEELYSRAEKGEAVWEALVKEYNLKSSLQSILSNRAVSESYLVIQLAALLSEGEALTIAERLEKKGERSSHPFAADCAKNAVSIKSNQKLTREVFVKTVIGWIEAGNFSI